MHYKTDTIQQIIHFKVPFPGHPPFCPWVKIVQKSIQSRLTITVYQYVKLPCIGIVVCIWAAAWVLLWYFIIRYSPSPLFLHRINR